MSFIFFSGKGTAEVARVSNKGKRAQTTDQPVRPI